MPSSRGSRGALFGLAGWPLQLYDAAAPHLPVLRQSEQIESQREVCGRQVGEGGWAAEAQLESARAARSPWGDRRWRHAEDADGAVPTEIRHVPNHADREVERAGGGRFSWLWSEREGTWIKHSRTLHGQRNGANN